MGLFLVCGLLLLLRLGRLSLRDRKPDLAFGFFFAIAVTLLVFSFSEKVLMVHSNINWVLFLLAGFYSSRALTDARRQASSSGSARPVSGAARGPEARRGASMASIRSR